MTFLASTLPSNDGYVAAAYIVFFVLLLAYLAIMGIRLTRMERRLQNLHQPAERRGDDERQGAAERRGDAERHGAGGGGHSAPPGGEPREEELV